MVNAAPSGDILGQFLGRIINLDAKNPESTKNQKKISETTCYFVFSMQKLHQIIYTRWNIAEI